jgi:hypothetical protein
LRLGEYLDPFNAAANSFVGHARAFFFQKTSLAYFDCFWMFAVLTFVLVFVALLMKRSVAEKGARHGSE